MPCRCGGTGRHARLKIVWAQAHVGSTPTIGTGNPFVNIGESPNSRYFPMNFQEALSRVRDSACVPQRGNTCLASGGVRCDPDCPAFQAGLKRRETEYKKYRQEKLCEETQLDGKTIRIRQSQSGVTIVIEEGEYSNDRFSTIPVFTLFRKYEIPKDLVRILKESDIS